MTGHRKRWIVRKNRAARRSAMRTVRARPVFRELWFTKLVKNCERAFSEIEEFMWAVPDRTYMESELKVEPYSMERMGNWHADPDLVKYLASIPIMRLI